MPNRRPSRSVVDPEGVANYDKTTLPSGIRVVTEHIPSVRSIAVGAWVDVGSRDETDEEAGVTHFIEHMVFKGTRKRRMHHIAQRMEAVGGYLNAFTTKEYTCYYTRALDEHLKRALDTVLDLVFAPTFPTKDIEKEKEVVLEEIKMYEDVPEDLLLDRFEDIVYADHPLARPVLGYPETVTSFSRGALQDFVRRYYRPNNVVIAVAGNVSHRRVVSAVERLTADLDLPPSTRAEHGPIPPYRRGEWTEARPTQQGHLVLGGRGLGLTDSRRSTLNVLNTVLGGGMSSRLNQNVRERYGFCYNIYSFANLLSDTGDVGVYVGIDASRIDKGLKVVGRELDRMATEVVSDRQLAQAKSQLKGSLMLGLESMSNRMMRLGRMELVFGRYFSLDEITQSIEAVTDTEVRDLAADLFDPDRLSTVLFIPQNLA